MFKSFFKEIIMRKIGLYVGLLVVLGGLAAYLFWNDTKNTLSGSDTAFAVKDTAAIGKIFMAEKSGNRNIFKRSKEGWLLNDSVMASPPKMKMILNTIYHMRVRSPVPKAEMEVAVKNLSTKGIKVEVYDTTGKKMNVFYIGGPTQGMTGTYALREGFDTPYILHILGFDGYLTPRFAINPHEFRDLQLVACRPNTLQSVEVSYPDSPEKSFRIVTTDTGFGMAKPQAIAEDSARMYQYLKVYGQLHARRYLWNENRYYLDSLSLLTPEAVIQIEDEVPENNRTFSFYPTADTANSDRLAIIKETQEVVLVDWYFIRRMLLRPQAFEARKEEEWYYM